MEKSSQSTKAVFQSIKIDTRSDTGGWCFKHDDQSDTFNTNIHGLKEVNCEQQ